MAKIKQAKEILVADFPKTKVVLNLESYIPYILNQAASQIWDFLKKPRDKIEVVEFLQKKYQVSLKQAEKDVQNFLSELREKGFLENS